MEQALVREDPRPAGLSVLLGRDPGCLEQLAPLTGRHLVRQVLLEGREATLANLRAALATATGELSGGGILFLALIDPDFAWESELAARLAEVPAGVRIFGVSTGSHVRLASVSTPASLLWLGWPGKDATQFTDRLVGLWNEGAYSFDHARFVSDLGAGLPETLRPSLLVRGEPNPGFTRQRPFTVSPPPPLALEALVETFAQAVRTKQPVAVRYRPERGYAARLTFAPMLLGTSGGAWRVWGKGSNQFVCLLLEGVVAFEGFRSPSPGLAASSALGPDHFQHCIQVVDVWVPREPRSG